MNRLFTKVDTSPKDTSAYPLDWSKLKKKKLPTSSVGDNMG